MKRSPLTIGIALLMAAAGAARAQLPTVRPFNIPKVTVTMADLKAQFPQNKTGSFLMEVPQILHTATDANVWALLTGQSVVTTGQILRETGPHADGRHLRICRTQLACCAVHAHECSVLIEFAAKLPSFKELAWVTLTGALAYKQEGGKTVPVIVMQEIKETAAPKNQLLQ